MRGNDSKTLKWEMETRVVNVIQTIMAKGLGTCREKGNIYVGSGIRPWSWLMNSNILAL